MNTQHMRRDAMILLGGLTLVLVLILPGLLRPITSAAAPLLQATLTPSAHVYLPLVLKQFSLLTPTPTNTPTGYITYTVSIPGGKPTAVEAYHTGNKFYVADGFNGKLLVFDGNSRQLRATIPVGPNVYGFAFVINETYGRAYAASRAGDQGLGVSGTGLVYVVDTLNDTLLTTLDPGPPPPLSNGQYVLGHDETRDRVYVGDYGSLVYIDVATNTAHPIALPGGIPDYYWRPEEIAVNETANDVYMVQTGTYGDHHLWTLDADAWTWSSVNFPSLGAYYPQHVAVSEAENKVFVKLIGVPGQAEPGLYVLDRDNGSYAFMGSADYGKMVVNESSGRLFTGVEVSQEIAIVEVATNQLTEVPLAGISGAATVVDVRYSTDHAFLAQTEFVIIVDGSSHTVAKLPVPSVMRGGLLEQDVAVNQNTGWVFVITDDEMPFVIAVQDPPAGPLQ